MPTTAILGHRGASGEAPENTLRAFALAADQGADGIELDVQPATDGTLVIMHDDTVDRTTSGQGRVADLSYTALAALDAGAGERVPTLEEALRLARGRLLVDIEIKDPGIEPAVAALVGELGMADEVVISSFYPASLAAMRAAAPHLRRWLLSPGWSATTLATALDLGAAGVAPRHPAVDAALVATAREHGLAVVTWTANADGDLRRLLALDLDAIITDYPARAVALRGTL
ncbi:MAG: glycerophosphodiester phosphodiesterase [Chloroflexi bacterium]|nr:glycerophosphodiester phosphodiesterase [Chloroflexota bacterium]